MSILLDLFQIFHTSVTPSCPSMAEEGTVSSPHIPEQTGTLCLEWDESKIEQSPNETRTDTLRHRAPHNQCITAPFHCNCRALGCTPLLDFP